MVESNSLKLLESIIADLQNIAEICARKNLENIPPPALSYLAANSNLIEWYLEYLYSKTSVDQRQELLDAHPELDYSAVPDEFFEIAKSAIQKATHYSSAIKLELLSITEDDIRMLLRALKYVKYCDLAPHSHQLTMSPIAQHGLESYRENESTLTKTDIQAIRWDISDILYLRERSRAFEECRAFGLEMNEPRDNPRAFQAKIALKKGSCILMELLQDKATLDFTAVMLAAPHERQRYVSFIETRIKNEYLFLLELFRGSLIHLLEFIAPLLLNTGPSLQLSRVQKDHIGITVQNELGEFRQNFENFLNSIENVQPTPEAICKMRELLPAEKGVTIMGDVFQNIKNSTIISRSVVEGWNQAARDIDLPKLARELSELRTSMLQKASTPEQAMATGKVATAEKCATTGDGAGALQHLKDAGKWALEVATDIGTKVAAEVIKKSLGL